MGQPPPLFREGFHFREKNFVLPEQTVALEPRTKRELTICNLFVNHNMSIPNIQHLLDEDTGKIVNASLTIASWKRGAKCICGRQMASTAGLRRAKWKT